MQLLLYEKPIKGGFWVWTTSGLFVLMIRLHVTRVRGVTVTDLVVLDLSACSESLDISISLIASLTSSFSTDSIMRRRACNESNKGGDCEWGGGKTEEMCSGNLDDVLIVKVALCRHCQTETSAMPSGMAGNCPSLRLSTPASLSTG